MKNILILLVFVSSYCFGQESFYVQGSLDTSKIVHHSYRFGEGIIGRAKLDSTFKNYNDLIRSGPIDTSTHMHSWLSNMRKDTIPQISGILSAVFPSPLPTDYFYDGRMVTNKEMDELKGEIEKLQKQVEEQNKILEELLCPKRAVIRNCK